MSVFLLILGLLLFIGLVVVHEFGHYMAARRNGIEVEEFGIGFPPRAMVLARKKGTVYSLNWLPLGGFVKLKGEHDADTEPGSFGAAGLKAKVKVMLAGIGMNLITAFVLLTALALLGLPKILDNQFTVGGDTKIIKRQVLVGFVEKGSPAQKAGLAQRDQLISIGQGGHSSPIANQESLPALTKQFAGQTVQLTINRQGKTQVKTVSLRGEREIDQSKKNGQPKGYLGISPTEYTLRRSTWSAPLVAGGVIGQFTQATLKGLGSALSSLVRGHTGQAGAQVSGPVGIFVLLKDGSTLGYQFVLLIIAVISLTLAIMNVLPIPALDGGRLFVILAYRVVRRKLTPAREELISGLGFAILMVL